MAGAVVSLLGVAVVKRINAKRAFWCLFGVFAIVWVILIGVWAVSDGGYFWPGWAIFGMGIAQERAPRAARGHQVDQILRVVRRNRLRRKVPGAVWAMSR